MLSAIWTVVGAFFKGVAEKYVSKLSGVQLFFVIVAVLCALWLFLGESIQTSLGFQTKANLQAELALRNAELERLSGLNKNLSQTLEVAQQEAAFKADLMQRYYTELSEMKSSMSKLVTQVDALRASTITIIKEKTVVEKGRVCYPVEEMNKLASENHLLLSTAYSQLFQGARK